jgi:hypothetical protein
MNTAEGVGEEPFDFVSKIPLILTGLWWKDDSSDIVTVFLLYITGDQLIDTVSSTNSIRSRTPDLDIVPSKEKIKGMKLSITKTITFYWL